MFPNGCLIFEDEGFRDSTVVKMNALRKSGQFCDVRLQVCGHEFMAHKAVLACCSPYLFEIFNSDSEPQGGVSLVKFDDLNPDAVEILLSYAYTTQLKADKDLVSDVYSAAKKLKLDRVKQLCGDYLLSKMDCQSVISYRNFASSVTDCRLLSKIDSYIHDHLQEISKQDDFLKLPRLKLDVILEENLNLPGNGKLYSKVISWVQRSLWKNGDHLEKLMEEKKPPREKNEMISPTSSSQFNKHEWKYIASEKTTNNSYLCLAVLRGVLCVISLYGRSSPQSSSSATPCMLKSLSFEAQPEELQERLLKPMHYARSGLGTAELEGKLIAAGGYNREECLRTVECYSPKNDCWTFIAPMRTPRARFQMAVLMGRLYVIGGSNGHSDELSCGEMYDPKADEWSQVPELRTNRCNAGVCSLQNKLFVVGGSDPCGQKGLKNCDSFDLVSKSWTSCAPLNIRRHQAAVCELDGSVYVIGGAESWNCLNSVECYNPENNTWTLVAPMNLARRGAGVAVYKGKLFVVGGFDGSHALRCVEVYDPARNEWRMLGSMTSARSNAGVAVLNGVLCAVGGFDGNEFLNTMEVYDPDTNEWSPFIEALAKS
ncbi:influenza virus NS1A-binding protein homolog B-like isoform X2 [Myxocyprinus asiaticus]|uniref:influenza virus NS1A-binding protein homolog B-like isoform X2 n=1 Tax=Myxocyprinus asiaticus TaxID=70543 RepID=UPI002222A490|nr:influenza virus NS1A-binding protein homolog B-like isoform X2 [Myxocyprinus asiaticus]